MNTERAASLKPRRSNSLLKLPHRRERWEGKECRLLGVSAHGGRRWELTGLFQLLVQQKRT